MQHAILNKQRFYQTQIPSVVLRLFYLFYFLFFAAHGMQYTRMKKKTNSLFREKIEEKTESLRHGKKINTQVKYLQKTLRE